MLLKIFLFCAAVKLIKCQSAFRNESNSKLCNFFDTINITDGYKNIEDHSIIYEEIRYAKENYGTFTYTYLVNQEKINVAAHTRGCVCKYKNCVRLCCPPRHSFNQQQIDGKWGHKCVPNNNVIELDLSHLSNIQLVSEMPCVTGFWLDPNETSLHEWKVLGNGSLYVGIESDYIILPIDKYCIAYVPDNETGRFNTKVMMCIEPTKEVPRVVEQLIYPAVMLISVVFLSLTLFVYGWIPELRTLHGKTFMCYLASLIIGYLVLAISRIANWHAHKGLGLCIAFAEVTHTAFIAGFIWLSIIGYDIWRAVGRANPRTNQFLKYCMFAFGCTFLIVGITNLLDHVNLLKPHYRPGLGTTVCWLQDSEYSRFIYLYLIIIIIIAINAVFFMLTKLKIEKAQKLSMYATKSEDSRTFAPNETDADRFQLFFRLVIIMGLPWTIEIISWLTNSANIVIYIMDIITMLMGPVIFFICIKKPRIKRLVEEKWSTMVTLRTSLSKLSAGCSTPNEQ